MFLWLFLMQIYQTQISITEFLSLSQLYPILICFFSLLWIFFRISIQLVDHPKVRAVSEKTLHIFDDFFKLCGILFIKRAFSLQQVEICLSFMDAMSWQNLYQLFTYFESFLILILG